jgi:hypothetical protein
MGKGDAMTDFCFSVRLSDKRELCLAPISREAFEANEAHALGDDYGYFIYEFDTEHPAAGIEILGKALSYEAALRLIDIYMSAATSTMPPYADSLSDGIPADSLSGKSDRDAFNQFVQRP